MNTLIIQSIFNVFFLFMPIEVHKIDTFDEIESYLKDADSRNLAALFAPRLEMEILNQDNDYSKAQAEIILRDFLLKNKAISVKTLHKLNSNPNYRFAVFSYLSMDKKFRISFSMTKDEDTFSINAIRIEFDKE